MVLERLAGAGHRAVLAGGCVRDILLGRSPQDLDVATSALPEQVEALFTKTIPVGKSFGVIRVLESGVEVEVATFRRDVGSADGRRPERVEYGDEKEDALRRDLTVNAMFLDPLTAELRDEVGGWQDLQGRCLRAVGDPRLRFQEDHLRLLRVLRFHVQLGFSIEEKTWKALCELAPLAAQVSRERIHEEMEKMFRRGAAFSGLELMQASGLHQALFPQIAGEFELVKEDWRTILSGALRPELNPWLEWLGPLFLKGKGLAARGVIEELRLSRQDRQALKKAEEILSDLSVWRGRRRGQKTMDLDEASARQALALALRLGALTAVEHQQEIVLWQDWQSRGGLPAPWIRGEEAGALFRGEELGRFLRQCYWDQLEGKWPDRDSAGKWLQAQLVSAAKGS